MTRFLITIDMLSEDLEVQGPPVKRIVDAADPVDALQRAREEWAASAAVDRVRADLIVEKAESRLTRLKIQRSHHADILEAERQELSNLGDLAEREAESSVVKRLHTRVAEVERRFADADDAVIDAERHLDDLRRME